MSVSKSSAEPTLRPSDSSTSLAATSSYMPAGTKQRVPASHICPPWRYTAHRAPGNAISRSASSSRIVGPLPPSSSPTGVRLVEASCMIRRPTAVEPVKAMRSTRGSLTKASPATVPVPGTTLSTPLGRPASRATEASSSAVIGVNGEGFRTRVLPVARAGATFHTAMMKGKFHGITPAQTPKGSRCTNCQAGAGKSVCGTGSVYSSRPASSARALRRTPCGRPRPRGPRPPGLPWPRCRSPSHPRDCASRRPAPRLRRRTRRRRTACSCASSTPLRMERLVAGEDTPPPRSVIGMSVVREDARGHLVAEGLDRARDLASEVGVRLDELRIRPVAEPEEVGDHQNLPIAVRTRPDPDRRDAQGIGDLGGKGRGNSLQDQGEDAGLLQGVGLVEEPPGILLASPLDPVPAHCVHRLRSQANVAHDRNPSLDESTSQFQHGSLELDRMGPTLLEEPAGVTDALLQGRLIREERHVAHDQGVLGPAGHRAGVVEHLLHGDGQRVLVAKDVVGQRVTHQQGWHPCFIENPGGGVVVGGEHDESLAAFLEGPEIPDGDAHRLAPPF